MIPEEPPEGEPVNLPAPYDTSKWEQDPAGNWHRKSRAGRVAVVVIAFAIVAAVIGSAMWSKHQEDLERERDTKELTCALVGGFDC